MKTARAAGRASSLYSMRSPESTCDSLPLVILTDSAVATKGKSKDSKNISFAHAASGSSHQTLQHRAFPMPAMSRDHGDAGDSFTLAEPIYPPKALRRKGEIAVPRTPARELG